MEESRCHSIANTFPKGVFFLFIFKLPIVMALSATARWKSKSMPLRHDGLIPKRNVFFCVHTFFKLPIVMHCPPRRNGRVSRCHSVRRTHSQKECFFLCSYIFSATHCDGTVRLGEMEESRCHPPCGHSQKEWYFVHFLASHCDGTVRHGEMEE